MPTPHISYTTACLAHSNHTATPHCNQMPSSTHHPPHTIQHTPSLAYHHLHTTAPHHWQPGTDFPLCPWTLTLTLTASSIVSIVPVDPNPNPNHLPLCPWTLTLTTFHCTHRHEVQSDEWRLEKQVVAHHFDSALHKPAPPLSPHCTTVTAAILLLIVTALHHTVTATAPTTAHCHCTHFLTGSTCCPHHFLTTTTTTTAHSIKCPPFMPAVLDLFRVK